MNLVTRAITRDHALGGRAGSRFLFVTPWRGVSIVCTSHDPFDGQADSLRVREQDLAGFLSEVHEAFPAAALTADDVRLVHRGLLPATDATGRQLLRESVVRDHRADGVSGVMSVLGVRYTTARGTAESAVDRTFSALGYTAPACRTAVTPLRGGAIPDWERFLSDATSQTEGIVDVTTRRRLALSYGSDHTDVLRPMCDDRSLATPLSDDCPVTRGEILHAVRHEMALRLSDAMLRRTEAGSAGHPGRVALEEAARIMGSEAGWAEAERAREVKDTETFYRLDP